MGLFDLFKMPIIIPGQIYQGTYKHSYIDDKEGKIYFGVSNLRKTDKNSLVYVIYVISLVDESWHFECNTFNLFVPKVGGIDLCNDLGLFHNSIDIKDLKYTGNFSPPLTIDSFMSTIMKEKNRMLVLHSISYLILALVLFVYTVIVKLLG